MADRPSKENGMKDRGTKNASSDQNETIDTRRSRASETGKSESSLSLALMGWFQQVVGRLGFTLQNAAESTGRQPSSSCSSLRRQQRPLLAEGLEERAMLAADIEFSAVTSSQSESGMGGTVPVLVVSGDDLTLASDADRTVYFAPHGGTAHESPLEDYTMPHHLVIPPGDYTSTRLEFSLAGILNVNQDTLIEGLETVVLAIDSVGGALQLGNVDGIGGTQASTTHEIIDDDRFRVTIDIVPSSVVEGTLVDPAVVIETAANGSSAFEDNSATIGWGAEVFVELRDDASSGSATTPDDYEFSGVRMRVNDSSTFPVWNPFSELRTNDDGNAESDETVVLTIFLDSTQPLSSQAVLGGDATLTITDNDPAMATITIAATTQASEPSADGQFTVTLSNPSSTDTTVTYTVAGDATADVDYDALTGMVTIPANQTSAAIDVTVINDSIVEASETVVVKLDSISSGDSDITIGTANEATVTIADDDMFDMSQPVQRFDSTGMLIGTYEDIQAAVNEAMPGETVRISGDADPNTPGNQRYVEDVTIPSGTGITLELEGAIEGDIDGNDSGTTIRAIGDLTMGDASSGSGFAHEGTLETGDYTVTLLDSGLAILGAMTIVSPQGGATTGNLIAANNVSLSSDDVLTGDGCVTGDVKLNSGTVAGNLTIKGELDGSASASGKVAPGFSPGAVTSGDLTLTSGTFDVEIDGAAGPGVPGGHDITYVDASVATGSTGTVTLGGGLNIQGTYSPGLNESFRIIDNDGSDAVIGTFSGLAEGANVTVGTSIMKITYVGGDGNDVVLYSPALIEFAPDTSGSEGAVAASADGPTLLVKGDLTNLSAAQRTVTIATTTGTATAGATDDYTITGTYEIPAAKYTNPTGEPFNLIKLSKLVINQDTLIEGNETIGLSWSGPGTGLVNADVDGDLSTRSDTTHTITDDDFLKITVVDNQSQSEGTTPFAVQLKIETAADGSASFGTGNATIAPGASITFDVIDATTGAAGDAVDPDDYAYPGTTPQFTLSAGYSGDTETVSIPLVDDALVEGDELVHLEISDISSLAGTVTSNPLNTQVTHVDDSVKIADNDQATWSVAGDANVDEGSDATYTISLTGSGSGTAPFILQAEETASVDLAISYPATGTSSDAAEAADFTNTFLDDVTAAITAYNNTSGASGTYALGGSTLTYTHGATDGAVDTLSIVLATADDSLVEGPEDYKVAITAATPSSSTGAAVAVDSSANEVDTTITDNDTATFTVEDVAVDESTGMMTFTVTLSNAITNDLDLTVSFTDGTATGSGVDYTSTAQTVTFTSGGSLTQDFTVPINDESALAAGQLVEADETFDVSLAIAAGTETGGMAIATTDTAVGRILNDDTAELVINDITILEGDSGTTTGMFTISIDNGVVADEDITVNWKTADDSATAGSDYAAASGTATISAGTSSTTVTVTVNGDLVVEPHETFNVVLSEPTYDGDPGDSDMTTGVAQVEITDDTGVATINNDDALIEFQYTSTEQGEDGTNGTSTVFGGFAVGAPTLVVSGDLTGVPESQRTVELQTTNISAFRNSDFDFGDDTVGSVTITIPAANYSGTDAASLFDLTVVDVSGTAGGTPILRVTDDTLIEGAEDLNVDIIGFTSAFTVGDANGIDGIHQDTTHIIVDNDTAEITVVANETVDEEGGLQTFDVVMNTGGATLAPGVSISVDVKDLLSGTASTTDYSFATQTVVFSSGDGDGTTKPVNITPTSDTLIEGDETVNIGFDNLSAGAAASQVTTTNGTVTIVDADRVSLITIDNPSGVTEGGMITFTVTSPIAVGGPFTVPFTVSPWTAGPADYSLITQSPISFTGTTAGETQTIQVRAVDDTTNETPVEVFLVRLGSPAGTSSVLGGAFGTGIIIDNDRPSVSVMPPTAITEGNSGSTTLTFDVVLSGSALPFSVDIATGSTGTATAGVDYVANTDTLSFSGADGETRTFHVTVFGDTVVEPNETVQVVLTGLSGAGAGNVSIASGSTFGTILNDDTTVVPRPQVSDLILDSSQWAGIFRDWVDGGFDDGVDEGYRVTDYASDVSVPWIAVDRIKVQFDANVGASLDVSDFALTGAFGYDVNNDPGAVPTMTGVTYSNTSGVGTVATIHLSDPLDPNKYTFTVIGSGINDGTTSMGSNRTQSFVVLPGDSSDEHGANSSLYLVNGVDRTFIRDRLSGFLFDQAGSNATDGAYFAYDARGDVDGDGKIDGSDSTEVLNRTSSFVFEPALTAPLPGRALDGVRSVSVSARDRLFAEDDLTESAVPNQFSRSLRRGLLRRSEGVSRWGSVDHGARFTTDAIDDLLGSEDQF